MFIICQWNCWKSTSILKLNLKLTKREQGNKKTVRLEEGVRERGWQRHTEETEIGKIKQRRKEIVRERKR